MTVSAKNRNKRKRARHDRDTEDRLWRHRRRQLDRLGLYDEEPPRRQTLKVTVGIGVIDRRPNTTRGSFKTKWYDKVGRGDLSKPRWMR